MSNILDYINWRGDLSFEASPFNTVDNLILARLAYLDFDDLKEEGETLSSIAERYTSSEERMNPGILLNEGNKPLLEGAGNSVRFGNLKVKAYVSKIDLEAELQFSAVVYEVTPYMAYVAYRGTDDTLVGWKEDFNMTFMDVVPAQTEALAYLHKVIREYDYKKLYIGGHSKGGNLAVYAAVRLSERLKPRIAGIYNNDGPGFKNSLIETEEYQVLADRIITLVPKSSVVGVLLEHEESFQIVDANTVGALQHDGFSWEVLGNDFVYLPELADDAKIVDQTTKKMLEKMTSEEREHFSNVLFDLLSVNDSKTLTELNKTGIRGFFKMTANYRSLDEDTKKIISSTMGLFLDESYQSFLEVTELDQLRNKWRAWQLETKSEVEGFFKNTMTKASKG